MSRPVTDPKIQRPAANNSSSLPVEAGSGDEWLFGWDPLSGIVSVWADRGGRAFIWQRVRDGEESSEGDGSPKSRVTVHRQTFRPWLVAANLADLGDLLSSQQLVAAETQSAPFTYRELNSPHPAEATLRYLISAGEGSGSDLLRTLQRVIVEGAGRRLGRSFNSLRELPGWDYYMVGPVEQYLMGSGRVYFRGLAYADLHRLQFDLETTGLLPQRDRIFLIAVRDNRGFETILEAPQLEEKPEQEAALIRDLCALIRQRDPDVIENHNLFGFDLPFLEKRAAALGVALDFGRALPTDSVTGWPRLESYEEGAAWGRGRRTRYSVAGRELIDTLDAVRRYDFSARDMTEGHGLKAAARYFGVAAADRTYLEGSQIYATYRRDPARVRAYAFDDVREVDGLSRHLMGAAFALAQMAPRRYERVASAGPATGILEPMLVRAYLHAGVALPRNAAAGEKEMDPHQGGATILYQAGVVRHVVKADIASMYPSIMRTYGIGPGCDPLKALLYVVDRLTRLRLEHKEAARAATARGNSQEAQSHQALQAAMKIVINSAYGYMGAGKMALFADRKAADEVTGRGRKILGQVAGRLAERGMVLLEADTDGIFFATPAHWGEAEERALVAEVGAELPELIRLEYEGRYAAMLSHEVKNYALLTYDGRLIVRGGAFHSRRSERFGEEFLVKALEYVLAGDSQGVRRFYLETLAALREYRYQPEEVSLAARLAKTPEEYTQSRQRSREAAYEALLAAGRTAWRVGETVKFYRAAGNKLVWLRTANADTEAGDTGEPALFEATTNLETVITTGKPVNPSAGRNSSLRYDVDYYIQLLHKSYISRLRKAYSAEDFEQLFRLSAQAGLFDRPIEEIEPLWIVAS